MILRLLAIIFIFYWLSYVVRNLFTRPFREGYKERDAANRKEKSRRSEGRVSIFTNGAGKSRDRGKIGEYIDYEEVQDEEQDS